MRRNCPRALALVLGTVPWFVAAALAATAMGPSLDPEPSPLELKTNNPPPPSPPPPPPAKANENTFEPWELVSV